MTNDRDSLLHSLWLSKSQHDKRTTSPRLTLAEFVRSAWSLIEPARPFVDNWAVGAVCEHLQAVSDGQIKRLVINIPPGMAKSTLVSVLWPPWDWTRKPWLRWMFASHRMQLAFRDAGRRRLVVNSQWYRERWGNLYEAVTDNLKYATNSAQGSMFASSVDSQDVLGFRAQRLVLDDPHDPQGAISDVQRATTTEWLNLTWPTRKDDTPDSAEVLVMQRLHELDATGLYLAQGGWTHLKIPMEHKGKTFCAADRRAVIGQLIDERVQSREYVDDKKRRLGPWGEAAQYDQEPYPLGGGIVKRDWFGTWRPSQIQPGHYEFGGGRYHIDPWRSIRFSTVDLAMTEREIGAKKTHDPDWTVMAAWILHATPQGPQILLADLIRERMEGPELLPKLQAFHAHWKFLVIAIEDISEKSWYQYAQRARLPVREISTRKSGEPIYTIDRDKLSRLMAATPLLSEGRMHLPAYAPWLADFVGELVSFPNGTHDDCCDVVSAACAIAEKLAAQPALATPPAVEQRTGYPDVNRQSDEARDPTTGYFPAPPLGWR